MGSIIGRVADRVSGGLTRLNNVIHPLSINDETGKDRFNGGTLAFDNVNWQSQIANNRVVRWRNSIPRDRSRSSVKIIVSLPLSFFYILFFDEVMSYLSRANSEGYPGDVLTQVKYTWTDDNQLHINIRATATRSTPVNITNYCVFNLAGHVRAGTLAHNRRRNGRGALSSFPDASLLARCSRYVNACVNARRAPLEAGAFDHFRALERANVSSRKVSSRLLANFHLKHRVLSESAAIGRGCQRIEETRTDGERRQ